MARVELHREWEASGIDRGLDAAIETRAHELGMSCTRHDFEYVMRGGSQLKMRMIGGWLGGPAVIPREVRLRRQPGSDRSEPETVKLDIEERAGFVSLTGMKAKLAAYFAEIADQIEATLRVCAAQVEERGDYGSGRD